MTAADKSIKKYNILLIMADEHDPAVSGCYGDPLVRTPNIDCLAEEGVRFSNAYTTSPLCVPARLSFLSGKYVSKCKAWNNNCWLPSDDFPSLPGIMGNAGYECVLGGKMHLDPTRRYGYRELFPTQENMRYKDGTGFRRDPGDCSPGQGAWEKRYKEFYVSDSSEFLDLDRETTDKCSGFISSRSGNDKPFFLTAGYFAPHFPLIIPEEYYNLYKDSILMPEVPDNLCDKFPVNYKQLRYAFGLNNVTPEMTRKGRALYWGYVSWIDNQIGKLLNALKNSGAAENTIVIYTADHGENKGDHGLWWKNNMYEHSAGIPLIIRWPNGLFKGQKMKGVCSLIDLTRTIAEIGGAEVPADWDGDSLIEYINGHDKEWKNMAVCEYFGHNVSSGFSMIRQDSWKYVYHTSINNDYGAECELYDLSSDKKELNNLAGQMEYAGLIRRMHSALQDELGRDPEEAEAECRKDIGRGYRRPDNQFINND